MSEAAILAALDKNDTDAARDVLLRDLYEAADGRASWDSPQYTTDRQVQQAIALRHDRNSLFTYFGLKTLEDRYFLRDGDGRLAENPQSFWARVATGVALAGFRDEGMSTGGEACFTLAGKRIKKSSVIRYAQKLYDVISRMWFIPATPILTNIGTNRGLPISCFLSCTADSMEGITDTNTENAFIGKGGGGIGTYWGDVRGRGAKLSTGGESSGVIPFLKITDAQLLAVSQGAVRRGAGAVYLPVWHPDIEDFIEIRRPSGDENRRCLNTNHGVVIDDAFMQAAAELRPYDLRCPKTGAVVRQVDAHNLLKRIITVRMETGEPYMLFIDTVNRVVPQHHREKGLMVKQSNLCCEIVLPTTPERTAVCCLGSMNLETYDQWREDKEVVYLAVRALDNVLQAFCNQADDHYAKSKRSAEAERSVGLGVMGYHGLLMGRGLPFESVQARQLNKAVFKDLNKRALAASRKLAEERGVCPDAVGTEFAQRNSYVMAIAPTATISTIAGNATPCIEPTTGNAYQKKTMGGSFLVKNRYLADVLARHGQDTLAVWQTVIGENGSAQHLDFLTEQERAVFRTAWEINQREVIQQAADRAPHICQGQSLNLFFEAVPDDVGMPTISMRYLYDTHFLAWSSGCKGLYYIYSQSTLKATSIEQVARRRMIDTQDCAVCQ